MEYLKILGFQKCTIIAVSLSSLPIRSLTNDHKMWGLAGRNSFPQIKGSFLRYPKGKLLLLKHVQPGNPILGFLFEVFNPIVIRMMGININRKTVDNISRAEWRTQLEEHLSSDMVRWIEAEP